MITLNVGRKGEIVIPKKIRESLGIIEGGTVKAELKGKTLEINPPNEDIIKEMEEMARMYNIPSSELIIDKDEMYENELNVY